MCECLDNAALLGAPAVLLLPDHSLHGQTRDDCLKRTIESIDAIAQHAAQYPEIVLGLEVLHFDETDILNTAEDAITIMDEVGYQKMGVVLDTGTLNLSKEPVDQIFSRIGDKVLQVHVNDNPGLDMQENLIPGDGTFGFQDFIRFLVSQDYAGYITAELSKSYADDPELALLATKERLMEWIRAVS